MSRKRGKRNARSAALAALGDVLDRQRNLGESTAFNGLQPRDAAFGRRLAYGVLRWMGSLDWLAAQLLDKPLKDKDRDVHRLLLLGIYQLWKEDVSAHAAVHETAECARGLRKNWAVGLVNAVLRRFQRESETLLERLAENDAALAHPDWLVKQLQADWPDQWRDIVDANNRQAPLTVRVNSQRTDVPAITKRLEAEQFAIRAPNALPFALEVSPAVPVDRLPGFSEGLVSVQDGAAQFAAPLMNVRDGLKVLDACAAPGGKTCHLLEMAPGLDLLALDIQESRLARVTENLDRLGLQARLVAADAGDPDSWWDGRAFDRILLDAPCSATGVIRRHPEIKWLRDPQQVDEAIALQQRLLKRLWPLLIPGGILVYATCSVLRQENSQQIHEFLESHTDAQCLDSGPGTDSVPGIAQTFGCQILPGMDGMDGFYYAVLHKRA